MNSTTAFGCTPPIVASSSARFSTETSMPYSASTETVISRTIVPTSTVIATHARSSCMRSIHHRSVFADPRRARRYSTMRARNCQSSVAAAASNSRSRASTRWNKMALATIDSRCAPSAELTRPICTCRSTRYRPAQWYTCLCMSSVQSGICLNHLVRSSRDPQTTSSASMPASRSPSAHPRAIIVMATMMAIAAANSSMDAHS